jgi:hypothetical protein
MQDKELVEITIALDNVKLYGVTYNKGDKESVSKELIPWLTKYKIIKGQ